MWTSYILWIFVAFFCHTGSGVPGRFLCILLLLCSSYVIERREFLVALGAGFGLLALVIPENFFFYPCLIYIMFYEKMPCLAVMNGVLFFGKAPEVWKQGNFFILAGIFGFILAIFMEKNTEKAQFLEQELRRTRDDSRERNLLLAQKNKALLEKQDYEIYNATLKERNRIAREIHDNVGHVLSRGILMIGAARTINKDTKMAVLFGKSGKFPEPGNEQYKKQCPRSP